MNLKYSNAIYPYAQTPNSHHPRAHVPFANTHGLTSKYAHSKTDLPPPLLHNIQTKYLFNRVVYDTCLRQIPNGKT